MSELVTVVEQMYERQGFKAVEGLVEEIPPGALPNQNDQILVRFGEPNFQVLLAHRVGDDNDVPDEVGFALRRVANRLPQVMPDGEEVQGAQGNVEWIMGPGVCDGAVVLYLDTDGSGYTRAMIGTMTRIFLEELTPLAVRATISVAPESGDRMLAAWRSTEERLSS